MIKLGNNNIGKIYLGGNSIGKAYLGSNLVFQRGASPTPAVTIPYIRGGADGSYIDTGITADNTVKVIVWARNWQPLSEALCGSRTAADSNEYSMMAASGVDVDRVRIRFGTSNTAFGESAINTAFSNYHKYEVYEGVLSVDDVVVATATAATFSNNLNIHLFGLNTGGTHNVMKFPVDISACKIYKNDVLVRDFSAVNSPSVGMYDSVSETLFTNAGSGSFTYGSFNQNAYTPLEYIECNCNQYFDTGIVGTKALTVTSKFRITSSDKTFKRLYGCRTNNVMYELMVGNTSTANRYFDMRSGDVNYYRITASASQTNYDLEFIRDSDNNGYLYKDNAQQGSRVSGPTANFSTTPATIHVGGSNTGDELDYLFYGRIYFICFGSSRSLVAAKVNNVAGMYDTYNDVFYPSTTGTAFIAGPEL